MLFITKLLFMFFIEIPIRLIVSLITEICCLISICFMVH